MPPPKIAYCAISPGIGIARLGSSPDAFFVGPEAPATASDPGGAFKDAAGRVKRQAARFRIFAYDSHDRVVGELTSSEAEITWTVHLANKKASWFQFNGYAAEQQANQSGQPLPLRNADVADRQSLVVDPGPRSVSGPSQSGDGYRFEGGTCYGVPVPLGEVRTDEAGRLLVLGGFGTSGSVTPDNPIVHYANNDGWYDDTSDGPVTATVVLHGGSSVPVRSSSWVIVAPPDFAPAVGSVVSLYDVATSVAVGQGWATSPEKVSFAADVFPILAAAAGYSWVNATAFRGHRAGPRPGPDSPYAQGRAGDFLDPARLAVLADNSAKAAPARQAVYSRLRNPSPPDAPTAAGQANFFYMPILSGDGGFATVGQAETWFTVLPHQYEILGRWAAGDFEPDWAGSPPVPVAWRDIPVAERPAALDRAALEHCVGGPFFPGIEMTYVSRDASFYAGAYRLRPDLEPGDLGKRMALPWQADFYECQTFWWPAQRPDDVVTDAEFAAVLESYGTGPDGSTVGLNELVFNREKWARGLGASIYYQGEARQRVEEAYTAGDNDMVYQWDRMGFVVPRSAPDGSTAYVETERSPYAGLPDRQYFRIMLNLDAYPDFLPMAKSLAEGFLASARALQGYLALDDDLRSFPYTQRGLDARLDKIYDNLVDEAATYEPANDPVFSSREKVVELIRQTSVFNQVDGAWLRSVAPAGPMDEVRSYLFSIWTDESGNGDPQLNHANVYTDLMHSVGIYSEDIASQAYADNSLLLDSAFTLPLLELTISQFTDNYFPEILGMTLFLEWEVLDLQKTVKLMEAYGINSQFYRLHVGIDNAADGHGAMAKRAVQLYLDQVRAESGEAAVQEHWDRIWTGYVAFRTTGTFGEDLYRSLSNPNPPSLTDRVVAMVVRKAPYASLNHGLKRLGTNLINDLFDSPYDLLQGLLDAGLLVPGDPDGSPFFRLTGFTGPMYKVFTPDELRLWSDWIRSLADNQPAPTPPPPGGTGTDAAAALMVRLVDTMRARQVGVGGHMANQLTGPDPSDPTKTTTLAVAQWFDAPTPAFLAALANEDNGWVVKGDAGSSRFVTELLSGSHPMAQALADAAPGTSHKTWRSIAIDWINAGCPIPTAGFMKSIRPERRSVAEIASLAPTAPIPRLSLLSTPEAVASHPRQRILGMGAVH
ncbi:MAG: LodA/GoxA family CTQ-dependent oxidase [Acidimicrobiales bacterium]